MPRIFISYRRQDSASLANLLKLKLKSHGIDSFLDVHGIEAGGVLPDILRHEIERCDVFVCLLGATTLESSWVSQEVELANKNGKVLVPVLQERFDRSQSVPNEHFEALLRSAGIEVFDIKGIYVDEAIGNLARLVKGTVRQRKANHKRSSRAFTVLLIVLTLIISALFIATNTIFPSILDNLPTSDSSSFPTQNVSDLGITDSQATETSQAIECNSTLSSRLTLQQKGYVVYDLGLNLRREPRSTAEILAILGFNQQFTVIGGPDCVESGGWWRVALDDGSEGWILEGTDYYLVAPVDPFDAGVSCPASDFNVGNIASIGNTPLGGLVLWRDQDAHFIVGSLPQGTQVILLDGPVCKEESGVLRWFVRITTGDMENQEGWTSEARPGERWFCPVGLETC